MRQELEAGRKEEEERRQAQPAGPQLIHNYQKTTILTPARPGTQAAWGSAGARSAARRPARAGRAGGSGSRSGREVHRGDARKTLIHFSAVWVPWEAEEHGGTSVILARSACWASASCYRAAHALKASTGKRMLCGTRPPDNGESTDKSKLGRPPCCWPLLRSQASII